MTDAVTSLKNRRGRGGGRKTTTPPPPDAAAPTMGDALTRTNPALFDPAEMPTVIEVGGHVPHADYADYYVRAEIDGVEFVVPDGCRTAVARTLWMRGQHVRRDVYLTYLATTEQKSAAPTSADPTTSTTPAPPKAATAKD